jgi:hypothetical protein
MTGMLEGCNNIVKSDVRLPHMPAMNAKVINTMYSGCQNLAVDIYNLIPINGFSMRRIDMNKVFNGCKSI